MSYRRTRAIARKELRHIVRDPRSLWMALAMPALMLAFALSLWGLLERNSDAITTFLPFMGFLDPEILAGPRPPSRGPPSSPRRRRAFRRGRSARRGATPWRGTGTRD